MKHFYTNSLMNRPNTDGFTLGNESQQTMQHCPHCANKHNLMTQQVNPEPLTLNCEPKVRLVTTPQPATARTHANILTTISSHFRALVVMVLLILLGGTAWGQTLTVYDGTSTSEYVPLYGYWADAAQHNQMLYLASDLTAMNNKEITQMVFYFNGSYGSSSSAVENNGRLGTWTISLGETNATTLDALDNATTRTQVYEGLMTWSHANLTLTITFANPYTYHGGNLLVDFNHAAASYNRYYFYGVTTTNNMAYTYNSARKFQPKTTFSYRNPPSCPQPSGVTFTSVTSSSAIVNWTENGTATNWTLQYSTSSDFTSGVTGVNITSKPYTITGLSPVNTYYVRVRANCGGGNGNSEWSTANNFSTTAVATVVGNEWCDNFEGASCGWERINGSNTNAWAWGTATNNGGAHSIYISNDGGTTNAYTNGSPSVVYATKFLTFADGQYTFTYDWKAYAEECCDYLRVALVPAPATFTAGTTVPTGFSTTTLPTGWTALDGGSKLNYVSTWQTKSVTIDVVAGNYYMVLAWRNDGSVGSNAPAAVDNVCINRISCPQPSDVTVTSITSSSAIVNWTEMGTATNWTLQYSTSSDFSSGVTTLNISSKPYTITGLTPITTYYVRVRSNCGGANGNSEWSTVSFSTVAVPTILGNEWCDNFEGASCGWERINGSNTNAWAWGTATNNGGTHSIYISNDGGTTNAYNINSTSVVYATKLLTFADGQYVFTYDWKAYGESEYNDYLRVALVPAPATFTAGTATPTGFGTTSLPTGWTALDGGSRLNLVSTWQTKSVTIDVVAGNYYMVLAWYNDGSVGTAPPAAVDNVCINRVTCPQPSNVTVTSITSSSAIVNWTENGSATAWDIYYNTSGTAPTSSTIPSISGISTKPYTITGLSSATTYYVWVRANCGGGDLSSWVSGGNFHTDLCSPENVCVITFVLTDSWGDGWNGASIRVVDVETGTVLANMANQNLNGTTGSGTNEVNTLTLSVCSDREIQFSWVSGNYDSECSHEVYDDNGVIFSGSGGMSGSVNYTPHCSNCPQPTGVSVSNITETSAHVSWTGSGTVSSYNVRYRKVALSEGFEDGIPSTWTTIDYDEDGHNWVTNTGVFGTHGGDGVAISESFDNNEAVELYPDNWLITPQVDLGGIVSFWYKHQQSYPENFMVYVSTTGTDIGNFTPISTEITTTSDYQQFTYNLSSYAGQQGYIAIRHFNVTDQFLLLIDDFVITSSGGWIELTTTSTNIDISNLIMGSNYEVQVQGDCGGDGSSSWSAPEGFITGLVTPCNILNNDFNSDLNGWVFVNGQYNGWVRGTPYQYTGTYSSNAIFVSDNGTDNSYYIDVNAMNYATKELNLAGGTYRFSYDWIAFGEYTWDFVRVALVPSNVTLTGGTVPAGFSYNTLPAQWIALDGGIQLNAFYLWQKRSVIVDVPAGNYKLVFAWRNDDSQGTPPPVAIDNVEVVKMTPPTPTVTGTTTICYGSSASLSTSTFSTYEWSNSAGNTQTVTPSPSTTTDYTVTVTDGDGCEATSSPFTVTVNRIDATIQISNP